MILKVARLLHGMKGIHVTYHPHNVDTETFSRDDLAGFSVECMYGHAVVFPFSIGWLAGFQFSAGSSSVILKVARLLHGMKGIHVIY